MKNFVLFIILLVSLVSCKDNASKLPTVKINQGLIRGIIEKSVDEKEFFSFLRIPYAQPPIGNLRFANPVKAKKWEGILEADQMPEMCLQVLMPDIMNGNFEATIGKEDCLYLNVFTPKPLKHNAKYAVMVYIHGGGFMAGGATEYRPHVLMNENIVLVVIQYRLGVLGFLSTEDNAMPGNFAIKDQQMALQWVRNNIEYFGGDSKKVTIFGESAGGGAVHLHMFLPGSKGLFNGVIAQSGSALCRWCPRSGHKDYAKEFGQNFGCDLGEDSNTYKLCMQKQESEVLIYQMLKSIKWGMLPLFNAPRVEEDFLPDLPDVLLQKGKYNKVNLMIGVTKDDGAFFTLMMYSTPGMRSNLVNNFSTYGPIAFLLEQENEPEKLSKQVIDFYLDGKSLKDDPMDDLNKIFTDVYFGVCMDVAASLHSKDINVYMYEFSHRGQRSFGDLFNIEEAKNWVSHLDELYYLYAGGTLFPLPLEKKEDLEMRKILTQLWTNFAKFGNPTPEGSFNFIWTPSKDKFDFLNITTHPKMQKDYRKERRDFWLSLDMSQNRRLFSKDGIRIKKDEL